MDSQLLRIKQVVTKMMKARGYAVPIDPEDETFYSYYQTNSHIAREVDKEEIGIYQADNKLEVILPRTQERKRANAVSVPYYFHHIFRNGTAEYTRESLSDLYYRESDGKIALVYFSQESSLKKSEFEKIVDLVAKLKVDWLIFIAEKFSAGVAETISKSFPTYRNNTTITVDTPTFEMFHDPELYVAPPEHELAPKLKYVLNEAQRQELASLGFTHARLIPRSYNDPFFRFYGCAIGDQVCIKTPVVNEGVLVQYEMAYVRILNPNGR